MISHSDVATARNEFAKARGMLGKRYIPWLWTQGRGIRVRNRIREGTSSQWYVRRAEMGSDLW